MQKRKDLLRIGQLAKKAGVPAATIKHYVKEGLLPQPVKTSPNMAYYDAACIERINLIKRFQKEKFLPLDVIKRLIDFGEPYDEELELEQAILKSHKEPGPKRVVKGSQVARLTSYPLEKITLLEEDGLISPMLKNNVKYYDEVDLEIIELIKRREDLGQTFHHNLETIRIYRDCISKAVYDDIHLFIKNFLGDVPTKQAIKFLTDADDALDRFMVLFRYRKLRSFSEKAIGEMNALPKNLAVINIFPVEGRELPAKPPRDNLLFKTLYYFCRGEYDTIISWVKGNITQKPQQDLPVLLILSSILEGDTTQALDRVEKDIPKPSPRVLENTIAALAYLFSIGHTKGLSAPMYHTKKAMHYLKRIENSMETNPLISLFARYVAGTVYTFLPDVVETCSRGIAMLETLKMQINRRRVKTGRLPKWLARTLEFEIFPALQIRINRALARGYLKQDVPRAAVACLETILEIADPESEHADWARSMRLKISKG
jgi:DNA-binding transcriptional MerR regulator